MVDKLFKLILTLAFLTNQIICELQSPLVSSNKPKIGIIGAGAGASSAAYYLQKFTSNHYDITIFEKEEYIGGRSTTIDNYSNGEVNLSIELGASVFVKANKILWNAVKEFNMTTTSFDLSDRYPHDFRGDFGVWNGKNFVFKTNGHEGTIGGAWKVFWKYGKSPFKLYWLARNIVGDFVHFFYYTNFPFQLDEIVPITKFGSMTGVTGAEYLTSKGISEEYSKDIVEASTRVNYASNLNDIHGMEMLVSMSAEEAVSVVGGNYQLFENFIKNSSANLFLNTTVSKIGQYGDQWIVESDIGNKTFDQVIIATPLDLSGIVIEGEGISVLEPVEYRELHVTYVSTSKNHKIDHDYFGSEVPEMILTRTSDLELPFYSINIVEYDKVTDTIYYKIFSPRAIDNKFLSDYLFKELLDVSIIFSKKWAPYPVLKPKTMFSSFCIGNNLWYLNTMEEFISTMETSALAGASVAGLISDGKNTTEIHLPYY